MIIGFYEQAIEDTIPGCMVPCDEQRTKRGICFPVFVFRKSCLAKKEGDVPYYKRV